MRSSYAQSEDYTARGQTEPGGVRYESGQMIDPAYQPALDRLRDCVAENHPDRRYYVDFDYTLLLTNSTDAYLQSARPKAVFWPVLKTLGLARPWVLRGSNGVFLYRDSMRLSALHALRPALASDYDLVADQVFETHKNETLLSVLAPVESQKIVIVSFGLTDAIRTMLRKTRFQDCTIVASSPDQLVADRARGKLAMLGDVGLMPDASRDAVITDSKRDDQDLLDHVQNSFHIKW